MNESSDDWDLGLEYPNWKKELQSDIPPEAIDCMRAAIRDFHVSNRQSVVSARDRIDSVSLASKYPVIDRVPRWLGYAGAAIAVLASCVVTVLLSDNSHRNFVETKINDRELSLGVSNSQSFPSMMVSLTSPRNSIQSFAKIRNASFEDAEFRAYQSESQPIPGWFFPTPCKDAGYRVEIDSLERCEGRRSAVIDCRVEQPGLIGNLMQTLDASGYRNKTVRLTAALRADVADDSGQVQMWLRIDDEDMGIGFFDNMEGRPVRTNDWQYVEIVARVPRNAQFINFGAYLRGTGTAWIDDFQLEVID
jgi:hypothetical protein